MENRYELISSSVSSMYHDIQKIERVEMAQYGLKGPHAQCLLAMRRYPDGITASELCTLCDKDKAAISRTVAELERDGMVVRQARNGSVYRAVLKLTPQGLEASRQVDGRAQFAVDRAGETLTDEERAVMYKTLAMIASNLQTICEDGLEEE